MSWTWRGAAAAIALASLAGCSVGADTRGRLGTRDYSVDPTLTFYKIELSALMANPTQDFNCRFLAVFDQHDERIWQPFFTSFSPEAYVSFSVWPPEARVWEVEGRQTSLPTLFFRKEGPHFAQLQQAQRYHLVEIVGTVRSTFGEKPWIEVYYVKPVSNGPVYDDESLERLVSGLEDAGKMPASAIKNLDRAVHGRLHTHAKALAHAALGDLYEKRASVDPNAWRKAWEHYDAAVTLNPKNAAAREGLDRASLQVDLLRSKQETTEPQPEPPKPDDQPK